MATIRVNLSRTLCLSMVVLLLLVALASFLWVSSRVESHDPDQFQEHNCSTDIITDQLCGRVQKHGVPGSYCTALCSKDVRNIQCIGHGKFVFLVQYREHSVILKELKRVNRVEIRHQLKYLDKGKVYTSNKLDMYIRNFLRSLGVQPTSYDRLKQTILEGCDQDGDGNIPYPDFVICLQLIHTDEYVIGLLLDGYVGIPKIYGTCGGFYSVQYAGDPILSNSLSWSQFTSSLPPWNERALVAIEFLNVIEVFEKTPFGVLFLCDLQQSNFGVVRKNGGRFLVYAIDMDISYFEQSFQGIITTSGSCVEDKECDFLSCSSKCIKGECTRRLHSSNLQVLCREIFTEKCVVNYGLLQNPPESIDSKLRFLLQKCCNPDSLLYYWNKTLVHSPMTVLNDIRTLLKRSL